MSLETWKAEFYPVPADAVFDADIERVRHGLKKWRGLRFENLERHGVFKHGSDRIMRDKGGNEIVINGSTCALCKKYTENNCDDCPIVQCSGNPCDSIPCLMSPYQSFTISNNPEPMIALLEKTEAFCMESKL